MRQCLLLHVGRVTLLSHGHTGISTHSHGPLSRLRMLLCSQYSVDMHVVCMVPAVYTMCCAIPHMMLQEGPEQQRPVSYHPRAGWTPQQHRQHQAGG